MTTTTTSYHLTDFSCFTPYVNRPDLLERVCRICWDAGVELTVIDNSPEGLRLDAHGRWHNQPVLRAPVPLLFSQSMNWEFIESHRRGHRFCVHMHSDATFEPGKITELMDYARKVTIAGLRYGILYTLYDVLCCYDVEAALTVGGYDTHFRDYFSDQDLWARFRMAGYEPHNTNIQGVTHEGSATINSDPRLQKVNGHTFKLYSDLYHRKWGAEPGKEIFPFQYDDPSLGVCP